MKVSVAYFNFDSFWNKQIKWRLRSKRTDLNLGRIFTYLESLQMHDGLLCQLLIAALSDLALNPGMLQRLNSSQSVIDILLNQLANEILGTLIDGGPNLPAEFPLTGLDLLDNDLI